jgi:citrate synthase
LGTAVESQQRIDDETITKAAKKIVAAALATGGRMPGFGIPAHSTDPRAPALLKVAQETGAAGPYCRLLVAMEHELALAKGRPIPINLDGIVAALVLDFGFPLGCAAAFVMIPRSFSTLAHHLEEKTQNTRCCCSIDIAVPSQFSALEMTVPYEALLIERSGPKFLRMSSAVKNRQEPVRLRGKAHAEW